MEANEPNTTNQTTYILLNNEFEKIQGRIDQLEEKIDLLANGMNILIQNVKSANALLNPKKPSLADSLPDDDLLDDFEKKEATCQDYTKVVDDQLSEKELAPFKSEARDIYNSCPTEEELDEFDRKDADEFIGRLKSLSRSVNSMTRTSN